MVRVKVKIVSIALPYWGNTLSFITDPRSDSHHNGYVYTLKTGTNLMST